MRGPHSFIPMSVWRWRVFNWNRVISVVAFKVDSCEFCEMENLIFPNFSWKLSSNWQNLQAKCEVGMKNQTDNYDYCHTGKSMLMLLSHVPRLFWSQTVDYATGDFSVWKTVAARSSDFVVVLLHHLLSDDTATFNHLLTVSMVSFKHDNQNLSQMLTMDEADGKTDVQCALWKVQMSCILNQFSCLGYFGLSPLAASFLCASIVSLGYSVKRPLVAEEIQKQ